MSAAGRHLCCAPVTGDRSASVPAQTTGVAGIHRRVPRVRVRIEWDVTGCPLVGSCWEGVPQEWQG
jgi:hypothetical protein